jgi:hypothetical protein
MVNFACPPLPGKLSAFNPLNPASWINGIFGWEVNQTLHNGCIWISSMLPSAAFTANPLGNRSSIGAFVPIVTINHYCVLLADSIVAIFILFYFMNMIFNPVPSIAYELRYYLPKLLILGIAINFSLFFTSQIVNLINQISIWLIKLPFGGMNVEHSLVLNIYRNITNGVLSLVILLMLALIALINVARVTVIGVCISISPVAILMYLSQPTKLLAYKWASTLFAALMLGPLQILLLKIATAIGFSDTVSAPLYTLATLLLIIKLPKFLNIILVGEAQQTISVSYGIGARVKSRLLAAYYDSNVSPKGLDN